MNGNRKVFPNVLFSPRYTIISVSNKKASVTAMGSGLCGKSKGKKIKLKITVCRQICPHTCMNFTAFVILNRYFKLKFRSYSTLTTITYTGQLRKVVNLFAGDYCWCTALLIYFVFSLLCIRFILYQ